MLLKYPTVKIISRAEKKWQIKPSKVPDSTKLIFLSPHFVVECHSAKNAPAKKRMKAKKKHRSISQKLQKKIFSMNNFYKTFKHNLMEKIS